MFGNGYLTKVNLNLEVVNKLTIIKNYNLPIRTPTDNLYDMTAIFNKKDFLFKGSLSVKGIKDSHNFNTGSNTNAKIKLNKPHEEFGKKYIEPIAAKYMNQLPSSCRITKH